MNHKALESATKLRGGYYTKPEIAAFLARWAMAGQPHAVLEPSCGDGVFFRALNEMPGMAGREVVGFELEAEEASRALQSVPADADWLTVHARDFLSWALPRLGGPGLFDAALGNPPFIRYQYLDPALQGTSAAIFKALGLKFTRHTNAWVPFIIASLALLRPGGRLAMVVPAEILHVLHAQSLRTYLTAACSRVVVFDPQELWFEDALQGAVLLLAEKKADPAVHSQGVAIIQTRSPAFLAQDPEPFFQNATCANGETVTGKWMPAFLSAEERQVIQRAQTLAGIHRFGDVAVAEVGIVTGANKFFLVPDEVVQRYGLHDWAHPMFGRSEHVPGVVYDAQTHAANKRNGLPANFLWFRAETMEQLPPRVQEYIRSGESAKLHQRYKCSIREPWYSVPYVKSAPLAMLKRSHSYPRLVLNEARAFTTDTAYRVAPRAGVHHASLVAGFVNSLTALSAELEGRHYGGGVLELVPSEIARLLVPAARLEGDPLRALDAEFRQNLDAAAILERQDARVLVPLGLTSDETELLRGAWSRLMTRRHRLEADTPEPSSDVE